MRSDREKNSEDQARALGIERERWHNTRLPNESLVHWRQRQHLEDQIRLVAGGILYYENAGVDIDIDLRSRLADLEQQLKDLK